MKHLLYGVLAILCPVLCLSQIPLHGTVLSADKEPVAAATVTIKGTRNSTITASDGSFTLMYNPANLQDHPVLLVTAVGYEAKELSFKDATPVTITLTRRISELDEALVIAYGKTTRRLNTGSVSRITAKDISTQPVTNPLAALEGLVPGLYIAQASGLPGAGYNIQLRGINSLKQGTQPLFIVDGVPFMLNSAVIGQLSTLNNNIFNNINPADIESIEVLKDADATAIYGSQGANGVVLVTTKKGRAGKATLDLSVYTGFGKPTRTLPLLNTAQYLQVRREAFNNDGITPTLSNAPDLLLWDTTRYTDWKQLLVGGTARSTQWQATVSGGNAVTRFIFGTSMLEEKTVFPGNQPYRRGTSRIQLTHGAPAGKWKLNLSAAYTIDKKSLPLNDLTSLVYLPPDAPAPFDSSGNLQWTTGIENPMSYLLRRYASVNKNLLANGTLQYQLLPDLGVRISLGYNALWNTEESALPIKAQRPSATTTGTAQAAAATLGNWIAEPVLEYKKTLAGIRLSMLLGSSWQERKQSGYTITGTRYTNDDLLGTLSAAEVLSVSDYKSQYKYAAFFGRLSLNWKDRYLLNFNGRRDGSSRFGTANRFANFAAVGAAWIFADTKEQGKKSLISWGKLRSSIGVTGNDQVGDYKFFDAWSSSTNYRYAGAPAGVLPLRLFNPAYEWERVRKIEAGIDLGFFNNRIMFSAACFRNRSDNQLLNEKLPAQAGFTSLLKNLDASIINTGLELELDAKTIQSASLSWTTGLNISFIRNKLVRYPGLEYSSDKYNYRIGMPLKLLYTYQYAGIDPALGIYTFRDIDGNGSISSPADITVIGAVKQPFFGGLTNKWEYKNVELSCLLQFVQQTARNYLTGLSSIPGTMSNQPAFVMDRWQKTGDAALFQKFTQSVASPAYKAYNLFRTSSAGLGDASYIRLRNLHLSYTFPGNMIHKMKIEKASFFVEGQNLFTWTGYKGADPESQSITSLPPLRLLAAGIQLTF